MTHAQAQTAGINAGLDDVVVQIYELEISAGVEAQRILADPEHRARTFVGIQTVAGGHGVVQRRVAPLVQACGLERYRTRQIRDAGYARRRIRILILRHSRPANSQEHGQSRQALRSSAYQFRAFLCNRFHAILPLQSGAAAQ